MPNEEQVQYLFDFCRRKGVYYFDLQCELVDHLSEAIEEKMKNTPSLSFDAALKEVYKGFGIFGFSHVVRDKEVAIIKRISKRRKQYLKTNFTYPKIAFTIFLIFIFCLPLYLIKNINLDLYYLSLTGITAIFGFLLFLLQNVKTKKPLRKLMMLRYGSAFGPIGILLQFPNVYYIYFRWQGINPQGNFWLNVFLIGLVVVLAHLATAVHHISISMNKEAQQQYPMAFE
ncbi:MAG TPA: hypothetical protein PLS07_05000 [Niabella sp.]|nr:hypothetical protein [Niabella sp.]HQW14547.1 hypothetical protein [Niabella sp.]HQX19688.1 hypothetical protein [Niabella sp.]HQX42822.1 hypothetical protein [Niabella sp.]HRB07575.1 hypothetical protein [Niabella sp.]